MTDQELVRAALDGDRDALRAIDEALAKAAVAVAPRIDRSPAFASELTQVLRTRLLVAEPGKEPRIAAFRGTGPLVAWLSVAATRAALNMKRGERKSVSVDEVLGDIAAHEPDPELRHMKQLYRSELGRALAESVAELPKRDRAVLRLHYVDGMTLAKIGELYRVHESTASRWVAAAVEAAGKGAKKKLIERLSLSADTMDSIARMVDSSLDLSLRGVLTSE